MSIHHSIVSLWPTFLMMSDFIRGELAGVPSVIHWAAILLMLFSVREEILDVLDPSRAAGRMSRSSTGDHAAVTGTASPSSSSCGPVATANCMPSKIS